MSHKVPIPSDLLCPDLVGFVKVCPDEDGQTDKQTNRQTISNALLESNAY